MVVATGRTNVDATLAYAATLRVAPSDVVSLDLSESRLTLVPTIVMVSENGRVLGAWGPAAVTRALLIENEVVAAAPLRIQ